MYHTITPKRKKQLLSWCDVDKWPDWSMVIYINNVTLGECDWLYTFLIAYSAPTAQHVARGTRRYFGNDPETDRGRVYICGWDMGCRDGDKQSTLVPEMVDGVWCWVEKVEG
jgi:hypothetical protein